MGSFKTSLNDVLKKSGQSQMDVCRSSGIPKQDFNKLLNGGRRVGPKVFANLLKGFPKSAHQKELFEAYFQDGLAEVLSYRESLPETSELGRAAIKSVTSTGNLNLAVSERSRSVEIPKWLEQLIEEAIISGENDPELLELIRDIFKAILKNRRGKRA
jgi:hypothetical protein